MKLKSSVKYYLYSIKPAVIIFYIVMAALLVASVILNYVLKDINSSFGGLAASSMIFLFVVGICSFYEEFRMFSQNDIARNELWKSFLIAGVTIAAIMSAIDLLMLLVLSSIINTESLIMMLSTSYIDNIVLNAINSYFLQVLFYTLALSVGYLIRLIYYRMNKFGVIAVSVGVPVFFLMVLPVLSMYYNLEPIFRAFLSLLAKLMSPDKFYDCLWHMCYSYACWRQQHLLIND